MNTVSKLITVGIAVATISGCSTLSMTGLDAEEEFQCEAPEGVLCSSVSGVYANAKKGNLPSQQVNRNKLVIIDDDGNVIADSDQRVSMPTEQYVPAQNHNVDRNTPTTGMPLWRESRRLRLWVAPWEDGTGDLHDQSYVYVVVDNGEWVIDHNQDMINPVAKAGQ